MLNQVLLNRVLLNQVLRPESLGRRETAVMNLFEEAVMEQFAPVKRSKDGQPIRYLIEMCIRDSCEDLGPPMLLARGFAESGCFQQAAELPGQDSGLGGEVLIKKSFFGVVQKRRRADDFIDCLLYTSRCV